MDRPEHRSDLIKCHSCSRLKERTLIWTSRGPFFVHTEMADSAGHWIGGSRVCDGLLLGR